MMTNSEFLSLAEKIGQLFKAYDKMMVSSENRDALWARTKFHVKQHLDAARITPEQFDARMKIIAKSRRSITKLARMTFPESL